MFKSSPSLAPGHFGRPRLFFDFVKDRIRKVFFVQQTIRINEYLSGFATLGMCLCVGGNVLGAQPVNISTSTPYIGIDADYENDDDNNNDDNDDRTITTMI